MVLVAGLFLASVPGHAAGMVLVSGLTLDFKDANLGDVLRTLSVQSGENIVFRGDSVRMVTLRMSNVTLDEAFAAISSVADVQFVRESGYVLVLPSNLVTKTFVLRYTDVLSVKEAVANFLSPAGRIEAFSGEPSSSGTKGRGPSNVLIVCDTERSLSVVEQVISGIDVRPRQVAIEARLIETMLGNEDKLGIDWQVGFEATGAVVPTVLPFGKTAGASVLPTPSPEVGSGIIPEFPDGELLPYGTRSDFSFGKLNASGLRAALELIASRTSANLVANPKITTVENRAAEITVGTVIPIALYERQRETGTMEIVGYEEKKVGMRLAVTPRVGADSTIVLRVRPEVSEIIEYRGQFNERPVTSTREADTEVIVKSGETLVIGGLVKEIETTTSRKVPFLGDIPLLGHLFRHEAKTKQKVDLLVFVTPRIIPE